MGWQDFWNRPNPIYSGDKHRAAHYGRIFADLRPYLVAGKSVLDYGCGDALAAPAMAEIVGHVCLYDSAPRIRAALRTRFADKARISVHDDAALSAIADASIDLALLISVVQYLDPPDLAQLLATVRRVLKADGRLLVADVITPRTPVLQDVLSRLRFAAANGFLLADLIALARLPFSAYAGLRRRVGLAAYEAEAFTEVLAAAGFRAERLPRNIGPTEHRLAFLARPLRPA